MTSRCIALAGVLLTAGCSNGLAGPDVQVVAGQYGSADVDASLLATRSGAELEFTCGGYFATEQPLVLDADGNFRVRGRWRAAAFTLPRESGATLSGSSQVSEGTFSVTVNLLIDGGGPTVDPFHATLVRGRQYAGPPTYCPL